MRAVAAVLLLINVDYSRGLANGGMTRAALCIELVTLRDAMEVDESGALAAAAGARGLTVREVARQSILASRYKLPLDNCYVDDGAIAGRGCFASRDVSRGELLTIYPADVLITGDGKDTKRGVMWGLHVPESLRDATTLTKRWIDYEVAPYPQKYTIVGIPELDGESAYRGHFCNDGAALLDAGNEQA